MYYFKGLVVIFLSFFLAESCFRPKKCPSSDPGKVQHPRILLLKR